MVRSSVRGTTTVLEDRVSACVAKLDCPKKEPPIRAPAAESVSSPEPSTPPELRAANSSQYDGPPVATEIAAAAGREREHDVVTGSDSADGRTDTFDHTGTLVTQDDSACSPGHRP